MIEIRVHARSAQHRIAEEAGSDRLEIAEALFADGVGRLVEDEEFELEAAAKPRSPYPQPFSAPAAGHRADRPLRASVEFRRGKTAGRSRTELPQVSGRMRAAASG